MKATTYLWIAFATVVCVTRNEPVLAQGHAETTDKAGQRGAELASASSPSQSLYEPMAVGNVWRYWMTEANGDRFALTRVITSSQTHAGGVAFQYTPIHTPGEPKPEGYAQILRDDGVYIQYPNEKPHLAIPKQPSLGKEWTYESADYTDHYEVVSLDTEVVTPAGDFRCLVIRATMDCDGKINWAEYSYAKDVGLVKTEYDDGSVESLRSYRLKPAPE